MKHSKTNISKLVELYGISNEQAQKTLILVELYDISEEEAQKTIVLIEENLPRNYSSIVQDLAEKKGIDVTNQKIREIKGLFKADFSILSLLVELAQKTFKEKQSKKSRLKELLAS